jgi:hypothetical protein
MHARISMCAVDWDTVPHPERPALMQAYRAHLLVRIAAQRQVPRVDLRPWLHYDPIQVDLDVYRWSDPHRYQGD